MTFSMNNFTLTAEAIDLEAIEHIPCEGTIIPIKIDNIEGFKEAMPEIYGYHDATETIKGMYIFIHDESFEAVLCVEYLDASKEIRCIHAPRFEMVSDEITCLIPELLTAWQNVEPYNIA